MRAHSGRKSPRSAGGLVIAVVFGLLGLVGFHWVYSDTALILDSRGWVSGEAIIDTSWLDRTFSRSAMNYSLKMEYHFTVAGITYTGNRFEIPSRNEFGDEADSRRQLAPYAPGSIVRIYYDPKDPTRSVVRQPAMDYEFIICIGGVSLLLLVLSLVSAFGNVRKRSRARRKDEHAVLSAVTADPTVRPAAGHRLDHGENSPMNVTHRQPAPASLTLPHSIRSCFSTYVVLGLLGGVPALILIAIGAVQSNWLCATIGAVASGLLILWLTSFRIELGTDNLTFRMLVGGSASMLYSEIQEVKVAIDLPRGGIGRKAPIRLCAISCDPGKKEMMINIKVFSRRDLTLLMHKLIECAPQATFDERCRAITEGKMPSVFAGHR